MKNAIRLALGAVLATLAIGAGATAAGAQTTDSGGPRAPRTITVEATGRVRGVPDVLDLELGVETRARTAAEALSRNSELVQRVLRVLSDAGVAPEDVQTSNLSVSPVTDDDGTTVVAYAVTNTVGASMRHIERVGPVIDAATKQAGDEVVVHSVAFSFDDNAKLVAQARADAVKRARAQADQLATGAGVRLGDLLSVRERSVPDGPVVRAAGEAAAPDRAVPPVNPGSEELSVGVTLVYAIG